MPREKIQGLITQLHERLSASETSPQQELLMAQLQSQLDEWEGPKPPDGDLRHTLQELLDEIREQHPKATAIAEEVLESLGHMGL